MELLRLRCQRLDENGVQFGPGWYFLEQTVPTLMRPSQPVADHLSKPEPGDTPKQGTPLTSGITGGAGTRSYPRRATKCTPATPHWA